MCGTCWISFVFWGELLILGCLYDNPRHEPLAVRFHDGDLGRGMQ